MEIKQRINSNGHALCPLWEGAGGFTRHRIRIGENFSPGSADYNHLVFLLEGSMAISCNEFSCKMLFSGEILLIPVAADTAFTVLTASEAVVFTFDEPAIHDTTFMKTLAAINRGDNGSWGNCFTSLPLRDPVVDFLASLFILVDGGIDMELLSPIKKVELFILLKYIYTPRELASLLYPLTGLDSTFRLKAMRTYRNVSGIEEFAHAFGMEKRTFSRKFIEEFNTSPYQWLMEQKSKHVCFTLRETDITLREVHERHGFHYPAHFTRFCREQFGMTPMKLRKEQKQLKMKN